MADDLQVHIYNDISPNSLLQNTYQNYFSETNIIHVTEGEIQSIVCPLKAKESSGYAGVSTNILKMCNSLISKPPSYIFNNSIQTGVFPDRLKYAIVKPLFKNCDRSSISNYRPIYLLPGFSNILEKTMYCRLNQHLRINNVIAMEQYEFRKDQSTEEAAYYWNNSSLE